MGLFKPSQEQLDKVKKSMEENAIRNKNNIIPAGLDGFPGLAKSAYEKGELYFEMSLVLEEISGALGFSSSSSNDENVGELISRIAKQGWELVDTGYVFMMKDFMTSGSKFAEMSQIRGKTEAHYIFKRVVKPQSVVNRSTVARH